MSQSNLRDLVNLSNSASIKKTDSKNFLGKSIMSNTNSNKFYIGGAKSKNEVLYSDIMMRKEPSPNNMQRSNNPTNVNFANTQKKGFFNNNNNANKK